MAPTLLAQRPATNLDFEDGKPGQAPKGWFAPPAARCRVEIMENAKSGKQSVRLTKPDGGPRRPGNLMQTIDATPYRGKTVRLRGAVRIERNQDFARLWMRVDRAGGKRGFLGNSALIRSREWTYFEIVGNVAADANRIAFGLILFGQVAWLDDVSLVVGAPIAKPQPAKELTRRGRNNLVAFARLFGYVRHFHPSDEAAATDWDAFAVKGVRAVEGAKNATELAKALSELFAPIAPTVRVFPSGRRPARAKSWNGDSTKVLAWLHHGFGAGNPQSPYRSERVSTGELPDPDTPFRARLAGGVSCEVPLSVYANDKGTLPKAHYQPKAVPAGFTGDDRGTRLADVVVLWNILQHFYPYFDVVGTKWEQQLPRALDAAASDKDAAAFQVTLSKLVAKLHDGHGNVLHESVNRSVGLPLAFGWIENDLVITQIANTAQEFDIKPGDVVIALDGTPSKRKIAEIEEKTSGATPGFVRFAATRALPFEVGTDKVSLLIKRGDGEARKVEVMPERRPYRMAEKRPDKIAELKPGIYYVDLGRIDDGEFKAALDELAKAKGVVFDMRGYPARLSTIVLAHLIDKPIESARWMIPIVKKPDRDGMQFSRSGWPVQPLTPKLTGKIAFVTDARAISYAETYMGMVEHYELGAIVGQTTAGTNGNINPVMLPGGYRVIWTGMKVLKHDGSRHHGVGIKPTVPVERTIAGVRAGRDEFLEAALRVVSK